MSLYLETVRSLVAEGLLDPAARTLVVAGGTTDRQIMLDAGFTDVTISNLDSRMTGNEFAPYRGGLIRLSSIWGFTIVVRRIVACWKCIDARAKRC